MLSIPPKRHLIARLKTWMGEGKRGQILKGEKIWIALIDLQALNGNMWRNKYSHIVQYAVWSITLLKILKVRIYSLYISVVLIIGTLGYDLRLSMILGRHLLSYVLSPEHFLDTAPYPVAALIVFDRRFVKFS